MSRIILHLLEKDPDHGYESADGLSATWNGWQDTDAQVAEGRSGSKSTTCRRCCHPVRVAAAIRRLTVCARRSTAHLGRSLPGGVRSECGGQDGAGRPAVACRSTAAMELVRGGQLDRYRRDLEVRRRRCSGVPRAGPAAAGPNPESGCRVRERLLAVALGRRGAGHRGDPEEFGDAAREICYGGGSADRADGGRAATWWRSSAVVASRKRPVVFSSTTCRGRRTRSACSTSSSEEPIEGLLLVGAAAGVTSNAGAIPGGIAARAPERGGRVCTCNWTTCLPAWPAWSRDAGRRPAARRAGR